MLDHPPINHCAKPLVRIFFQEFEDNITNTMNREEEHLGQNQEDEKDPNTADQGEKNGVAQSEDQKDLDAAHGQEEVNVVEQSEENRSWDIATTAERGRQAASSGSFATILVNVVVPQAARSSFQTGGRLQASDTIFSILRACRYWWELGSDHDNIWRQLCTMVWGPERRLQPTWMEEYLQQFRIRSGRAIGRQYLLYDDFSLFENGGVRHLAMTDTHLAAATDAARDGGNYAIIFSLARPHLRMRYRPVTSLGTNPDSSSGLFHFPPNEATIEGLILLQDWLLFGLSGGHIFAIRDLRSVDQTQGNGLLRHLGWNRQNNIVSFAVQPTRFGNVVVDGYMVHFGGNSEWSIGLFMIENFISGMARIWRRINGREFQIVYHIVWPCLIVWAHIDDPTAIILPRHGTWIAVVQLRGEGGVHLPSTYIMADPPILGRSIAVSNGRMAAVDSSLTVWIRGGENYQDVLRRIQTPVERGLPGNGTISVCLNSRYFLVSSGHSIHVYEADTGDFCYTLRREVWERWSPLIGLIAANQRHVAAWAYGLYHWDLDSRAGRQSGER